jgi:type IV fimbrial biogenesis protein FimT
MHNQPEYNSGFTLMELMVTIAIAAILLSVAIPSFTPTIASNRLTTYANELVTALNLARSEAVKRGVSVTVRKVDTNSCNKLGAGANWENGWDVFTDINNNGNCETGDVLIRTYAPLQSSYTLRGNNNFTNFIRYKSDGTSSNIGSFVLCNNSDGNNIPEANTSKLITVNATGRMHIGIDADKDGIPEKDDGTEIVSCTVSPF